MDNSPVARKGDLRIALFLAVSAWWECNCFRCGFIDEWKDLLWNIWIKI